MWFGFNPRLPRGKATAVIFHESASIDVSIHAFREGRRLTPSETAQGSASFNPRLPRGKATQTADKNCEKPAVSIHAFREGRRHAYSPPSPPRHAFQSTPSAREGDNDGNCDDNHGICFNPRLPRGKATPIRQHIGYAMSVSIHAFREGRRLFTPVRGERDNCFNPRLPRGKATWHLLTQFAFVAVSIHAFREGRRHPYAPKCPNNM